MSLTTKLVPFFPSVSLIPWLGHKISTLVLTQDDRYIFFAITHEISWYEFELSGLMMLDLKEGKEPTEFIHVEKLARILITVVSPHLLSLLAVINLLVVSNDNRHLIVASVDKCITIYDITLKKPAWRFLHAHSGTLSSSLSSTQLPYR